MTKDTKIDESVAISRNTSLNSPESIGTNDFQTVFIYLKLFFIFYYANSHKK